MSSRLLLDRLWLVFCWVSSPYSAEWTIASVMLPLSQLPSFYSVRCATSKVQLTIIDLPFLDGVFTFSRLSRTSKETSVPRYLSNCADCLGVPQDVQAAFNIYYEGTGSEMKFFAKSQAPRAITKMILQRALNMNSTPDLFSQARVELIYVAASILKILNHAWNQS